LFIIIICSKESYSPLIFSSAPCQSLLRGFGTTHFGTVYTGCKEVVFLSQGSASESTLVGLLAAKERTVRRIQNLHPDWDEGTIKGKLVAYSSGT
jgi:hypothetical protein